MRKEFYIGTQEDMKDYMDRAAAYLRSIKKGTLIDGGINLSEALPVEEQKELMQYIYDNIMYAELNTKSDYCQVCGYDGEIQIVEEDGKLVWRCPNCGNEDQSKMNVARRTCGYIGSQFWNQGRTQEIKERVLHL